MCKKFFRSVKIHKELWCDLCLCFLISKWLVYLFIVDIGSTLARMVLRYQMKTSLEEGAASGSNGNFPEGVLDKFDEWTFIPDSYVDSVFGQSDDLDSEGIYYKEIFPLCCQTFTHWYWTIEMETKPVLIYLENLRKNVLIIWSS